MALGQCWSVLPIVRLQENLLSSGKTKDGIILQLHAVFHQTELPKSAGYLYILVPHVQFYVWKNVTGDILHVEAGCF